MSTSPTIVHLDVDQGADFSYVHPLLDSSGEPVDVSGYTAAGQIRKWYTSSTAVDFDVTLTTGELSLGLSANTTAAMSANRYVYDVFTYSDADVATKVMEGILTVRPSSTR